MAYHRQNGGLVTAEDLSAFSVGVERPLQVACRDHTVYACGPWCQGPALLQAFNLVEDWDLARLGHNSVDYIHRLVEVLKLVFADRERYYADPDFIRVPVAGLLSKSYAAERRGAIDFEKAWPGMPPAGDPWRHESSMEPQRSTTDQVAYGADPGTAENDSLDTSYVCVVDRHGNCFSATPSDMSYTTEVIPGTGLAVSSRGAQSWIDPDHPCAVAGGRRPRLTPNPALICKEGRPYMVLGTPGGDTQCQAMLQAFLNIVCFDMDPQLAVEAPRFATFSFPNSFYPHDMHPGLVRLERRIAAEVVDGLRCKGHRVELWPDWAWKAGGVCTIVIDRQNGVLTGAADPRRESYAIGW